MNNVQPVSLRRPVWLGALISLLFCPGNLLGSDSKETVLTISGGVKQQMELTLADLQKMERVNAKVADRDGKEREFEGVKLWDVIQKALSFDVKEHKELVNACVVVKARDGYQAVFAMGELAPAIGDKNVLMADRCDGKSLPDADGILRIVVPGEKMRSRWVRQVKQLEIVSLLSQNKAR